MAMAPPRGLSLAGSGWNSFAHINAIAANASLHSMASNSSPARGTAWPAGCPDPPNCTVCSVVGAIIWLVIPAKDNSDWKIKGPFGNERKDAKPQRDHRAQGPSCGER